MRPPSRRSALAAVLAPALLAAVAVAGTAAAAEPSAPGMELAIADDRPLRGQPVRITVTAGGAPAAGAVVEAIYRPNSSTTYREALPPADSSGTLFWSPRDAGPVTLEARPAGAVEIAPSPPAASPPATSRTVAVRYPAFPASGLAIMLLAGALLLGGAVLGFVMLLSGSRAVVPLEEPPST